MLKAVPAESMLIPTFVGKMGGPSGRREGHWGDGNLCLDDKKGVEMLSPGLSIQYSKKN